eukprot:940532-Pyramimonas_sp.AAC.1
MTSKKTDDDLQRNWPRPPGCHRHRLNGKHRSARAPKGLLDARAARAQGPRQPAGGASGGGGGAGAVAVFL